LEYSAKHGGETGFTMMCMHGEKFMLYTPENIKEELNTWIRKLCDNPCNIGSLCRHKARPKGRALLYLSPKHNHFVFTH
ncbi:MAG: hypothetical protein IJU65_01485, partial [Desulfovibrio sp.]|nr:hypothetical protein [Desulfovibrio sp.]